MKGRLLAKLAATLLVLVAPALAGTGSEYAPDRLIVKFRGDVPLLEADGRLGCGLPEIDALNQRWGIVSARRVFPGEPNELARSMGLHRVYVLVADGQLDVTRAVSEYRNLDLVEYADPDYIAHADATTPNDVYFASQWGLRNTGQNPGGGHPGIPGCDIDAERAWDVERGSRDIVIGILDSGLDLDHPDFRVNFNPYQIWRNVDEIPRNSIDDDGNGYVDDTLGWNFVSSNNHPQADNTHGTHVGGIAGAKTNNSTGVAGTCWYCQLMPVKVLDAGGSGDWSWISTGIYYAANNGARIINMSLGGSSAPSALEDAVNYAWNSGVLVVVSMGNTNDSTRRYPASYTNSFAVGATDNDDDRVVPGHNGATWGSSYGSWIDVMAPGNWILSTIWNDDYGYMGGTSMAAPFSSGTAALLLSRNPDLTNQDLRDIIEASAEDHGTPGFDVYYGHGRINAYQALQGVEFLPGWKPESLVRSSGSGVFEPDVAVSGANLHVVFTDRTGGSYGGVYYMRSTDGGQSFGSALQLSLYQSNLSYYYPSVAVSGVNVHVVFCDNRGGNSAVYYKRSTDSGQSWSSDVLLSNSAVASSYSDVAVSGSSVHAVWDVGYRRSDNDGTSWGTINPAVMGRAIAASGVNVYVLDEQDVSGTRRIVFRRYNGASWLAPVYLSGGSYASWPDVAAEGNMVYAVWCQDTDGDLSPEDIYYSRSTNSGGGWLGTRRMTAVGEYQGFNYPRVAASSGQVHLTWAGDRDAYFAHEIYYQRGTNSGQSWGWCHRLCYNSSLDELPAVAAVGETVHVFWDRILGTKSLYFTRYPKPGPPAVHDVGCTRLLAPTGTIGAGSIVTPACSVYNYGNQSETYTVRMRIGSFYNQTAWVTSHLPGTRRYVAFANWTATQTGTHAVTCSTQLGSDGSRSNDKRSGTCTVPGPGPSPGWREVRPMPSGGRPVKRGAWLAWNRGNNLLYATRGYKTGDFFSYSPGLDAWTPLAPVPEGAEGKLPEKGCRGASDGGNYVYMTKGNNSFGFWRYSISANGWEPMADVPPGNSGKKIKGGTDLVYLDGSVDYIYMLKGYYCEFHRYNVAANAWEPLTDAPIGSRARWKEGSWLVHDEGQTLYAHKAQYHELWAYSLASGSWATSMLPSMPFVGASGRKKKSKDGGCGAWYNGAVYALKGGNSQEFWQYTAASQLWEEKDTMPAFGSSGKRVRVKQGADIASIGGGALYALKGNKTDELWTYGIGFGAAGHASRAGVMAANGTEPFTVRLGSSPARGRARVMLGLVQPGPVSLTVRDISGRKVTERRQTFSAGLHESAFDLSGLAAGVYLLEVRAGTEVRGFKFVLMNAAEMNQQ